ncbi:MAG: nucleotidyltransferase domain-containing protein [Patescibacteria group bacterium]|jgi:predicted nucleotidyltransferase
MSTKQLNDIVKTITKEIQPEQVVLFGSQVWGTPHIGSDIDLLVVANTTGKMEYLRKIRQVLFGHNFPPIDLITYSASEIKQRITQGDSFLAEIMNRGKIVYER